MTAIGVIPSRYASTRFPGKPLVKIQGKPLLGWVIEASLESKKLSKVLVATDHEEIAQVANDFGAEAVMTPSDLPSGTDRVFYACKDQPCDVVVNIQGDEPLIDPVYLDTLVSLMEKNEDLAMSTLGREIDDVALQSTETAKIVLNKNSEAVYFSRYPIPYSRKKHQISMENGCLKHIGIYAFRKNFLREYCSLGPVDIEVMEGLEQLRALYMGARIGVVKVDGDSWGVDNPSDVDKIELILESRTRLKSGESK